MVINCLIQQYLVLCTLVIIHKNWGHWVYHFVPLYLCCTLYLQINQHWMTEIFFSSKDLKRNTTFNLEKKKQTNPLKETLFLILIFKKKNWNNKNILNVNELTKCSISFNPVCSINVCVHSFNNLQTFLIFTFSWTVAQKNSSNIHGYKQIFGIFYILSHGIYLTDHLLFFW